MNGYSAMQQAQGTVGQAIGSGANRQRDAGPFDLVMADINRLDQILHSISKEIERLAPLMMSFDAPVNTKERPQISTPVPPLVQHLLERIAALTDLATDIKFAIQRVSV